MKKVTTTICVLIIIFFTLGFVEVSHGLEQKGLVMIVINKFDFDDIENMEYVESLTKTNAISIMNARAYQYYNEYSSNLTIGSGARGNASSYTTRVSTIDDETRDIYFLRNNVGLSDGKFVNMDIAALRKLNAKNNYRPYIGALGDSLRDNGTDVFIVGNSNYEDREVSFASLMTMGSDGIVQDGIIDNSINTESSKSPYGLKTNYEVIKQGIEDIDEGLVVIELGDLYRLDKYKGYMSDDAMASNRKKTLGEIDDFIRGIAIDKKDKMNLLIVSPMVSSDAYAKGKRLSPIMYVDFDGDTPGILSSPTTRRDGIIANLDIAPFISDYFGASKSNYVGKTFNKAYTSQNVEYIEKLTNYTAFIYMNRSEVLSFFAIYEILIVLLVFIILQLKPRDRKKIDTIYRFLILSNIAIPIALLLMPIFWPDTSLEAISILIVITVVLTSIAIGFKKRRIDGVLFLSGITCVLLAADVMLGSNLIKNGFLGYDPIIGARYYGIGNEYMGILIGCTLVFSTAILDRFKIRKWTVGIIYVLIIIAIGYPGFGANVGGSITAVFAFLFVMFKLYNGRLKPKHFVMLVLAVPVFIIGLIFIDLFLVSSTSHLGNAVNQIMDGGMDVVVSIIVRKVSMNIKLFNVSIWSKVLVISLGVLGLLFYRPFGVAKEVFKKYQNLKIGLLGLLVGCIVTFFVNDSGVVAAATAVIPLVMTLLYLVFVEIRD